MFVFCFWHKRRNINTKEASYICSRVTLNNFSSIVGFEQRCKTSVIFFLSFHARRAFLSSKNLDVWVKKKQKNSIAFLLPRPTWDRLFLTFFTRLCVFDRNAPVTFPLFSCVFFFLHNGPAALPAHNNSLQQALESHQLSAGAREREVRRKDTAASNARRKKTNTLLLLLLRTWGRSLNYKNMVRLSRSNRIVKKNVKVIAESCIDRCLCQGIRNKMMTGSEGWLTRLILKTLAKVSGSRLTAAWGVRFIIWCLLLIC